MHSLKRILILITKLDDDSRKGIFVLCIGMCISIIEVVAITSLLPTVNFIVNDTVPKQIAFLPLAELDQDVRFIIGFIFLLIVFISKNLIITAINYVQSLFSYGLKVRVSNIVVDSLSSAVLANSKVVSDGLRLLTTDLSDFVGRIVLSLISLINETLVILMLVIFLLYLDVTVTSIIFLVLGVLLGIITFIMARKGNYLGEARANFEKQRVSLINLILNNSNEIHLYRRVEVFKTKLIESTRSVSNVEAYQFFLSTLPKAFLEVVGIILLFIITMYFVNIKMSDVSALAYISSYTLALYRMIPAVSRFVSAYSVVVFGQRALHELLVTLESSKFSETHSLQTVRSIAFKSVFIERLDLPDEQNLSLFFDKIEFKLGQMYSLTGASGSGKTNFVNSFVGLSPNNRYRIYDDAGMSFCSNSHSAVIVSAKSAIIDGSIKENIMFGDTDACDDGKITWAIEAAQLVDFIKKSPNGIDTQLEYDGKNISQGQRQRIAIARLLYNKPRLVILDEATNALDKSTEKLVLEGLKKNMKDTVLIIISHDLDIQKFCDVNLKIHNRVLAEETI
jgi:ATP-binding cassette, subfamily B, bacterial PglK